MPADFVPLINFYQGNDSHAEYGNLSNYDKTVACNCTNDTVTIDYGCTNQYVSVLQLYNYTDAHVSVDDYYNRSVCFNTSTAGWGWHLQLSAVGAPIPADHECLFAIANRSNAHVYDCDNTNATLNVNLRILSGDLNPPTGSIMIWGPNGTILTGTRNVFLNLTFEDDTAVAECRWANDNITNLTEQPWENCTTTKAWILSETQGNKTVFYEIKDTAGNTAIFNDSILYYYTQDYTPPTPPFVYDGEEDDFDWWNRNDTLHANWFNSTDDISDTIYYRYRVMENGSCYNNDCNFTDTGTNTSVTVTGLTLYENWVYSFDVVAYVFNLSSSIASSNGTRIDLTPPARPMINSSTHPVEGISYPSSTVELNWSAEDVLSNGNMSGIEGYSYVLDRQPGSAPDNILDDRYWELLSPMKNDGYGQVLKINSTGTAYAVLQQIRSNVTENDSIRVKVALAEILSDYDDLMGVKVYLAKKGEGASISGFGHESDAVSNIENVSWDVEYSDGLEGAEAYLFDLTVNETVDDGLDDIYVVVSGLATDDDNRNNLSIAGSTAAGTGSWTWLCNETGGNCINTTETVDYAIEVRRADSGDEWYTRYSGLADGVYYFHAKAMDRAGNWGDTEHFQLNVAAGGVSVAIASPDDGQVFTTDNDRMNVSVRVMVSGNASVRVIALHPDGSNFTSAGQVFSTTDIFSNIELEKGTNEIYAVANTTAGAVTISSSVIVIVASDLVPVTDKTLRVDYAGCGVSAQPYICSSLEGSSRVGVANEDPQEIVPGVIQADTGVNTIKIFMSRDFSPDKIDDRFDDDDFLDFKSPSFGFSRDLDSYIIQNEIRHDDIFLSGLERLEPGKYKLYINHHGVTPDGKVNLSIEVR